MRRALVLLAAMVAIAIGSRHASADSHAGNEVVFLGLLPLDAGGSGDLVGLKTAQAFRVVVESSLASLSHKQVLGHAALTERIGKGYLPKWFECKNDVTCLVRILTPLRDAGNRLVLTGDYIVDNGIYHVHAIAFYVDGTVAKESRFDLTATEMTDPSAWSAKLEPLLASRIGRVRLASNVGEFTCKLDGNPCALEPDGLTLEAAPGEHAIELSKAGYITEKVTVTVDVGSTQEIAIALKPELKPTGPGSLVAGARAPPSLNAVRTEKLVEIDGKLDDVAWQKAWTETNFTQHYPDEGKAPTERTELRVLYDDQAIYIGIRCYDTHPETIMSRLTRRDRDVDADKISVDISSKNDHSSSYTFGVNAANIQVDGTRFNDTDSSTDLDSVWYSATTRDDKGWVVEMAIPLAALRYTGDTTSFGFQVRRYLERRQEVDEWSAIPSDAKGEVSYYGTLEGLNGLRAPRLLQLTPYDSRSVTFRSRQDALDGHRYGDNFGADAKVGLTPALTLDLTLTPDFGTVEVDQVVLNLSTFETFFPEKRPFFLESADLFDTPFQLFYSRRIGRTPLDSRVGDAIEPAPSGQILGAAKVTGVVANRLSIGVLDAISQREDIIVARRDDLGAIIETPRVLVDPLTNFAVVRLRQDFGQNSNIGLMATAVNRFEPPDAAAPLAGDPCPAPYFGLNRIQASVKGRCTNDAYTGGIDSVYRTEDGNWGASGQIVGSVLEHGPARPVPDGTLIRPGDLGWGVVASGGKYGGEHWLAVTAANYATPQLDINDQGFGANALGRGASRNDFQLREDITLRSTKPIFGLQNAEIRLVTKYRAFADTLKRGPVNNGAYLNVAATFPNFWQLFVSGGPTIPVFNNRELRDGALLGAPWGFNYSADVASDPRKSIVGELAISGNKTPRGTNTDLILTLGMRPLSFVELDVISDVSWSYGDPRSVATVDNGNGSRTYYLQDLDSRSFDILLRGTLTLSPTLSLQTYAQIFLASGHYGKTTSAIGAGAHPALEFAAFRPATLPGDPGSNDFIDDSVNINAFLRWQFRPGSAFWLAYTRSQANSAYDPLSDGAGRLRFDKLTGPATDVILVKLTYLWEPFWGKR
ncbi:hypothetical protein BH11MYX1_BH11MYX1_01380 [soil metagenome]